VAHVVHTGAHPRRETSTLYFSCSGETGTDLTKCAPGYIAPKSIFASGVIWGSRSAFWCVRDVNR
jgi:hypothetical protein